MNCDIDNPTFQTQDIYLAAFLLTVGHELLRISPVFNGPLVTFIFKRRGDMESLQTEYFSGEGLAPARKLFESFKALKSLAVARGTE